MTVKELIEKLKELPEDARVITRGYEGGYCDVHELTKKKIKLNVHKEWFYGPHDTPGSYGNYKDDDPWDEEAILI